MPRLFISAAHKSSGKTTVTLGLCRALRNRGLRVQAFKKGPDYIDPIWHGLASRRPCYNLDFHMMRRDEIGALFARHAESADISLIEGNKGLYDGMDLEGSNCNAALAKQLRAPVVLVLDTQGMTRGVAPLVLGYEAFDRDVHIAGVILNKVGGPRHEEKLRAVLERYTRVRVLGAIRADAQLTIAERHLGLMPANETESAEERIETIANRLAEQVDLQAVLALARAARSRMIPETPAAAPIQHASGLRLAYARDRVFGFYYQEDLDTLREAGVQLLPVDTCRDTRLPDCDGLLLGGGFPEMFATELAANADLRADIHRAVEAGLPVYAECGGLMYLCRSLQWEGLRHAMVGVIPGDVVMDKRPVGRGYAILEEKDAPRTDPHLHLPAHEFHYSHVENLPPGLSYAYRVVRGHGIAQQEDGFLHKHLLASYCHRRGSGPQGWIGPFMEKVRAHRLQRNSALKAA